MEALMSFVAKLGTVVNDRRFWVSVATILLVVGFIPSTVDPQVKADELMQIALAAMQVIGVVIVAFKQIDSWTKRPPSGKGLTANQQQADAVYRAILDSIKKG